jgi:peptidoglycan/LPS O-acetylase OafA/YrhL
MTAKNISLKYIPELDGLRAIAAFGVMFFHLHIPGFSLGWSGVYLFFVLSGFLKLLGRF